MHTVLSWKQFSKAIFFFFLTVVYVFFGILWVMKNEKRLYSFFSFFFLGLLGKWLHKFFCWFFLFYSFRFYIFWISLKICKWILLQDSKVLRVLKFVWMTFMYCTLNLCHSNIWYSLFLWKSPNHPVSRIYWTVIGGP